MVIAVTFKLKLMNIINYLFFSQCVKSKSVTNLAEATADPVLELDSVGNFVIVAPIEGAGESAQQAPGQPQNPYQHQGPPANLQQLLQLHQNQALQQHQQQQPQIQVQQQQPQQLQQLQHEPSYQAPQPLPQHQHPLQPVPQPLAQLEEEEPAGQAARAIADISLN